MGQICKSVKVDDQQIHLMSLQSAIPDDEKTNISTQNSNYKFLFTVEKKYRNSSSTIDPTYQNDSQIQNLEISKNQSLGSCSEEIKQIIKIEIQNKYKPCIRIHSRDQPIQKEIHKNKKVSFNDFDQINIISNIDWNQYYEQDQPKQNQ